MSRPIALTRASSFAPRVRLATQTPRVAEARSAGEESGLRAVSDLQLREDGGDVVADGLLAQEELGCNRSVGLVLCQELEDLELPLGQLRKREAGFPGRRRREEVLKPVRDPRAEDCLAVG